MPTPRRIIRRVQPPNPAYFDEQRWPVVVALVVMCGFLSGLSLAYLRFDDPRWYANAWTSLMGVGALFVTGILAVTVVGDRYLRRAIQFSLVVCTTLHILFLVLLIETELFSPNLERGDRKQAAVPTKPMPVYADHHFQPESQPQDFERPVESFLPQPESSERQETPSESIPEVAERPREVAPVTTPTTEQPALTKQTMQPAAPRPSDRPAPLTRHVSPSPSVATASPEAPQVPSAPRAPALQAGGATVARQSAAAAPVPAPSVNTPAPATVTDSAPVSRRPSSQPVPADEIPAPAFDRRVAGEVRPPRAEATSPQIPSVARQTRPDAPAPSATDTRRPRTTAAVPEIAADAPVSPPASETGSRFERRQSDADPRVDLAQTPEPTPGPRTRLTVRPDALATSPQPVPDRSGIVSQPSLEAAATTLPRATSAEVSVARGSAAPSDLARAPALAAGSQSSRPASSTAPTLAGSASRIPRQPSARPDVSGTANAPPSPTPLAQTGSQAGSTGPAATRATRQATGAEAADRASGQATGAAPLTAQGTAGSRASAAELPQATPGSSGAVARSTPRTVGLPGGTATAEAPSRATTEATGAPGVEPSRLALARSLSGIAGVGQSSNLYRAAGAGESPAMTPSAAARSATSSQTAPPGPGLSPSQPAAVARSRGAAPAPASALASAPIDYATVGGTPQAGELSASSSASLARSDAQADPSNMTASPGTTDFELGPTRIVDEGGSGRPSGGGQPTLNPKSQGRQLARRQPGGGVPGSDTSVAMPAGSTAGEPAVRPELSAAATGSERTAAGELPGGTRGTEASPASAPGSSLANLNSPSGPGARAGAAAGTEGTQPELSEPNAGTLARSSAATSAAPAATAAVAPESGGGTSGAESRPAPGDLVANVAPARRSTSGVPQGGSETGSAGAETTAATDQLGAPGGDRAGPLALRRAEVSDAPAGEAVAGGGNGNPLRSATGPKFQASTLADTSELAGRDESSGVANGNPLRAQGIEPERTAGGFASPMVDRAQLGTVSGSASDEGQTARIGTASADLTRADSATDAPSADAETAAAPVIRSRASILPGGALAAIDWENVESPSESIGDPAGDPLAEVAPRTTPTRLSEGPNLDVSAPDGPGGLGPTSTTGLSLSPRRTAEHEDEPQIGTVRLARRDSGGLPKLSTAVVKPAEAFSRRAGRQPGDGRTGSGQLGPQTEEAIERGLAFLARQQLPDGSWRLHGIAGEEVAFVSDTAATALALLSFQGAGYNHREHKYANVVFGGIDYLVKNQKEDGDLYLPLDEKTSQSAWLYSHSIATLALCEAYGMTQDPDLKEPAQRAIDFVVNSQNKQQGGWRYAPGFSSDTSVSGWMMMALKSGELSGLKVPPETYAGVKRWLDASQASDDQRYLYRYNPYAPDTKRQGHGRSPTKTMTAVGLLMRLYTGWRRDHPGMQQGAAYLLQNTPDLGTLREPQRDTYYWYYATQVMFHMGGDTWETWNSKLHPLLVDSQLKSGPLAGSWDPRRPIPDRWGATAGRLYVTTMNLLSLEVYYRHLPLYEDTAK